MGNEFSTGLAVQALLAMGSQVEEYAAAMEAMRASAINNTYHNVMAISQTLPALQRRSYLHVKSKECSNEDDSLVVEPRLLATEPPSQTTVAVNVTVVKRSGSPTNYSVVVPKSSTLLKTLELLQSKNTGFTFEKKSSLWGPFLIVVNGEQASQSDRRYWKITSDGSSLGQGIKDFKIERAQRITIKITTY